MNLPQLFLLCSFFIATQNSFALSCKPPEISLITTKNIYSNSVFWFNNNHLLNQLTLTSKDKKIKLISEADQDKSASDTNYNHSQFIKLKPEKPLATDQTYFFSKGDLASDIIYSIPYKTFPKSPTKKLKWVKFPALLHAEFIENDGTSRGRRGSVYFKFKTTLSADDHLLKIQYSDDPSWKVMSTYIINPSTTYSNESSFTLGFGLCKRATLMFKPIQTLYMKVDLISHDGEIIRWQGDPLKIEINVEAKDINKRAKTPFLGRKFININPLNLTY